MPRRRRRSSPPGFTLIEILAVLVILAIAAGLIIPNAMGTNDLQVISAARMLTCDLQYAQNTAITSQAPVTVSFNLTGESYALSNASGTLIHPITKGVYEIDLRSQSGMGSVDITAASFAGTTAVTFDETGAPDNPGAVTIQAGPHRYRVDVAAATGKVTVTPLGS